jgi:hypothetical protein
MSRVSFSLASVGFLLGLLFGPEAGGNLLAYFPYFEIRVGL